ncbi:hypothetical protein K440DRAFT_631732 [Wilcoxina mikolae CBS 423.85]|nr:hypothetical protein K440DRAFT_631732 [Wilcoxina mikolae CBS 423.85]
MKRKETLLKSECERFGKNLAILESGKVTGESVTGTGSNSRWAMLRGFIGATIEKKEEFLEMERKEKEKEKEAGMEVE